MPSYDVKKPFRDKDTMDLFGVGSEYYTEDSDRAKYLQSWGYLGEEIEPNHKESDPENENINLPDGEDSEGINNNQAPVSTDIKHVGGGFYELPNGEKVKGKDKALEALQALQGSDE